MRNFKQGKVSMALLWLTSFLLLTLPFIVSVQEMPSRELYLEASMLGGSVFGNYRFSYGLPLMLLSLILMILAGQLIGSERLNQGQEMLLMLPFKRKDLFLSRWLFGVVNIIGITLFNLLLILTVYENSILAVAPDLSFQPFVDFFIFMVISLVTVYTVALFMGLITGRFAAQFMLTTAFMVLPFALLLTTEHFICDLSQWFICSANQEPLLFLRDLPINAMAHARFDYRIWVLMPDAGIFRLESYYFSSDLPTFRSYLILVVYFVISMGLSWLLLDRNPNENNGKMVVYRKVEPVFLGVITICVALLGGDIVSEFFWNRSRELRIAFYYVGVITAGLICYFLLFRSLRKTKRFKAPDR